MPSRFVAITSGPSREPWDDVRFLSNVSSGRLGKFLTEAFLSNGHRVALLCGPGSVRPAPSPLLEVIPFTTAESLRDLLLAVLRRRSSPDLLVHAAAVADFAPIPCSGKLSSSLENPVLRLLPTPKVVDCIREACSDLPILLFKLESGIERSELHRRARATAARVGAYGIVANLLEEVGESEHRADYLRWDGTVESLHGRRAIAECLLREAECAISSAFFRGFENGSAP
ncbi:MAG: phosphopantothenoylcysteine decarboxylase [Planctomycetota bacterium]